MFETLTIILVVTVCIGLLIRLTIHWAAAEFGWMLGSLSYKLHDQIKRYGLIGLLERYLKKTRNTSHQ